MFFLQYFLLLLYKFKIADFFDSKQKFVQKNSEFATFYEVLQQSLLFYHEIKENTVVVSETVSGFYKVLLMFPI